MAERLAVTPYEQKHRLDGKLVPAPSTTSSLSGSCWSKLWEVGRPFSPMLNKLLILTGSHLELIVGKETLEKGHLAAPLVGLSKAYLQGWVSVDATRRTEKGCRKSSGGKE